MDQQNSDVLLALSDAGRRREKISMGGWEKEEGKEGVTRDNEQSEKRKH